MHIKHEFSLYIENLAALVDLKQKLLSIKDEQLIHRIIQILRLELNDSITFFDQSMHALCQLKQASKKELLFQVISTEKNRVLLPSITALVPLLKKDDLEQVIYDLTAIGVTTIQLVVTEKVQRTWQQKELIRLQKIIRAAAEQAKNFAFPVVKEPIPLEALTKSGMTYSIFADPNGKPLLEVMRDVSSQEAKKELQLFVGPEGDLTEDEKNRIQKLGFVFCRLTPTTLKSSQAMAILAAVCRSL